jgi:CBS domain-containing protein
VLTLINIGHAAAAYRLSTPLIEAAAMRISDICTRHVFDIAPSASVREAAEKMRKCHVGALVVIDPPNGKRVPIGIVTDRDIVVSIVAPGIDAKTLTVGDVMSTHPATCVENEDLLHAIDTMRKRAVRRLPVLNAEGGLAGMVTSDDVFGGLTREMNDLSRVFVGEQVREMQERPD